MTAPGFPAVVSAATLVIGAQYRSSGRTLTETDLALACMWSGDWHSLHADREASLSGPFGERVFPGTFGIVLAVAQAGHVLQFTQPIVAASGIDQWRYRAPLRLGATVHTRITVTALRPHAKRPWLEVARSLELCAGDTVIQSGQAGVWVDVGAGNAGSDR